MHCLFRSAYHILIHSLHQLLTFDFHLFFQRVLRVGKYEIIAGEWNADIEPRKIAGGFIDTL